MVNTSFFLNNYDDMINSECDYLHIRLDNIVMTLVSFVCVGSIIYYVGRFCPIHKKYTQL